MIFLLSHSEKELHEFLKFCGHDEATIFSNCFWASITSSNSFPMMIFLQLVAQEKEYMNQNRGVNIMEIVDKMVENWTQDR